jgi:D-arabinose 1-dehydrogenase-like Zn-dependent alcohol dehydrogenase
VRAVVVRQTGGVDVLRVEDVATPKVGLREVLIRIAACGVCTLDVLTRNGTYRNRVQLPLIPGHEIAGTVVEAGAEVRRFRAGDRVATTQRYHICGACRLCRGGYEPLCAERRFLGQEGMVGGYAQFVAVEEDNLAAVPASVKDEEAAIAACAIGTSLNAVRDVGRIRAGERVLVSGAGGGLGVHAVQLARLSGAYVIAQTTSSDKSSLLSELGAHEVLITERGEDFSERVRKLTGGDGVDAIIDNVGTPSFTAMRKSLAINGRWVLVGQLTDDFVPFNPAQLFLRNQSMLSVHSTTRAQLEDVLTLVSRGDLRPVITGVHGLDEVAAVHERMERGSVPGRIVLRPSGATG